LFPHSDCWTVKRQQETVTDAAKQSRTEQSPSVFMNEAHVHRKWAPDMDKRPVALSLSVDVKR